MNNSSLIELMVNRVSHPRLEDPAPGKEELEKVYQAALRAPDHMKLRPWRYLTVEGSVREKLGEVFCEAALSHTPELSDAQQDKYRNMPMRAPLIIIGIAQKQLHDKVPEYEQLVSAGVGMGYMLLALQALGYGAMWRTGPMAEHPYVLEKLGLESNEQVIGYLYVGSPVGERKSTPAIPVTNFVRSLSL